MSNVEKWNSGVAPGISAARLNEPFHVVSAVYDAVDDEIDVIIGHGRAQNGNGVVDLNTSDTTIHITSPVVSTTYYIFYNSDGTFTFSTTAKPAINTIILASVLSNNPLGGATTITDVRNLLQSPAFIKSIYDADGDTGIEVERTADDDTLRMKAGGTDAANITSAGLQLSAGARVTTIEDNDSLGTSDAKLCTQGNVKAYVDSVIGTAKSYGEAYATDMTVTISVTDTWYEVNSMYSGISSGVTVLSTGLIVLSEGVYKVVASFTALDAVDNTEVLQFGISVNNTMQPKSYQRLQQGNNESLVVTALLSLSEDDSIKLEVKNNAGTHNAYFRFLNFNITKL